MRNVILLMICLILIVGCKKDEFQSTPKLTFKEVNTSTVAKGQVLRMTLSVTDLEGDIQDTIFIERVATNCALSYFSERRKVPINVPVTKNFRGDFIVSYANGSGIQGYENLNIQPKCNINDTCIFRFMLKDKANHKSDTISSSQIVLIK